MNVLKEGKLWLLILLGVATQLTPLFRDLFQWLLFVGEFHPMLVHFWDWGGNGIGFMGGIAIPALVIGTVASGWDYGFFLERFFGVFDRDHVVSVRHIWRRNRAAYGGGMGVLGESFCI